MTAKKLKITYLEESQITPYVNNTRTHSADQIEKIRASINEFGIATPIGLHNGTIVYGHARFDAMKQLGYKEFPTVDLSHLTETQKKAYIIADNRLALDAGWDVELLKLELTDLDDVDFDLSLTGFDDDELADFLKEDIEPQSDEDAVPEIPEEPISKLGDIWILGNHRVMCGDSTSIDAVEKLMDGDKADMVFTDPPYNIDYGNIKHPKFKQRSIENDDMSGEEFADFCAAFTNCIKLTCNGCVYVFGPPGPDGRIMFTALDNALHCSTTIIWNKDQFTLGRGKYHNKYEPCWFGWNESGVAFIDDRKLTNVWDFPRPKKSDLHPTMKPVALVENAIGHASNVGAAVLDLFGGSGTTLIACAKNNRNARLMELDPKYCDVIVKRWQDYTGKEAILESTGELFNSLSGGETE